MGDSYATGVLGLGSGALAAVTSSLQSQLQAKISAMPTSTSSSTVDSQTVSTSNCPSDLTSAYASWYDGFYSTSTFRWLFLPGRAQAFYDALSADLAGTTAVSSATVTLVMNAVAPSFSGSITLVLYEETFTVALSAVSGTDVQTAITNAVVSQAVSLLVGMFPLLGTYGFS